MPSYKHRHQNAITVFPPETTPQPPQQPQPSTSKQNPKFLSILLQSLIMVSVIYLFFIFIGVATIIFMHLCIVGGALHRRRNRQQPISGNGEISSGLSLDLVNSLPVLSNQGEDVSVCVICLEDVGIGDLIRVLGCCDHVFHLSCVDKWLVKVPACPTCFGGMLSYRVGFVRRMVLIGIGFGLLVVKGEFRCRGKDNDRMLSGDYMHFV